MFHKRLKRGVRFIAKSWYMCKVVPRLKKAYKGEVDWCIVHSSRYSALKNKHIEETERARYLSSYSCIKGTRICIKAIRALYGCHVPGLMECIPA